MDYCVRVAKNADRAVVIDIGFTVESAAKHGRKPERGPIDPLSPVMRRHLTPSPALEGIVRRLDVPPV